MGALSLIELIKGAQDPVASGVAEHVITTDQVLGFLPWRSLGLQDHATFIREKALPTVSKPASAGTVTATATLAMTRVQAMVRRLVTDQQIDILDSGAAGGMVNARAIAIEKAAKATARTFGDDLITGNSNFTATVNSNGVASLTVPAVVVGPGHDPRMPVGIIRYTHSGTTFKYKAPGDAEFGAAVANAASVKLYSSNEDKWVTFTHTVDGSADGDITFTISGGDQEVDGLARLAAAAQTITPTGSNGDALAFATMDQLADLVKDTAGIKAYIMNSRTRRFLAGLMRQGGGMTSKDFAEVTLPSGRTVQYLVYNGMPVLASDWVTINTTVGSSTTTGSVYCATFGEGAGICGIYSEASMEGDDAAKVVSRGPTGLTVLNLGTQNDSDTSKVRVKAYWGLENRTEKGLAVATGITS